VVEKFAPHYTTQDSFMLSAVYHVMLSAVYHVIWCCRDDVSNDDSLRLRDLKDRVGEKHVSFSSPELSSNSIISSELFLLKFRDHVGNFHYVVSVWYFQDI